MSAACLTINFTAIQNVQSSSSFFFYDIFFFFSLTKKQIFPNFLKNILKRILVNDSTVGAQNKSEKGNGELPPMFVQ